MSELVLRGYGIERAEDQSDPFFMINRVRVYFKNGYELSIIRGPWTYGGRDGKFEIMLTDKPGRKIGEVNSEILGLLRDPEGWLTEEEVMTYIKIIGELP